MAVYVCSLAVTAMNTYYQLHISRHFYRSVLIKKGDPDVRIDHYHRTSCNELS